MCDIATIAGVALSGASAVANASAASSAARARTSALNAERNRQAQLQAEANAINVESQNRYQNINEQQAERATELGDMFVNQAEPIVPGANEATANVPLSSSNITLAEDAKQSGAAREFTNAQGRALGDLRSFGDLLGGIGRAQARDAGQIGQIGGFMRGSSSIVPYELEAAAQKGAGARMLGDVLGGAGSIATSAGLSGQGLFGVGAMKPGEAPRTFGSIFGR